MYNVMKLGRCIVPKDHSLNFNEMIKEKKLSYVKSIGEVETHFHMCEFISEDDSHGITVVR